MNLITINNYEAYLLDYVEENLSSELTAELMLFLEQNPELKEVLEDFEIHKLKPLTGSQFDKSILIKEDSIITLTNYEDFIVNEIEGENSVENSSALQLFLNQNPTIREEFSVYQKTKLIGKTILFENKKRLKKKSGVVIFMNWTSSAAAIIIILLSLNWFTNNERVYIPISGREEVNLNNVNDNVLAGVIILEEKKLNTRNESISKRKNNKLKEEKIIKRTFESFDPKDKIEEPEGYASIPDEKKQDSIKEPEIPKQKNIVDSEEEVVFAENSVTITYEDEPLEVLPPKPDKKKITKLDLIRAAVKNRINGNLGKGKEKVLFALNTKPLNFIRKSKKK